MITASLISNDSVSDITGYTAYSEARYGSNGDFYGAPELVAANSSDCNTGRVCYDSMSVQGFDSAWNDAQLSVNSSGVSWAVAGEDTGPTTLSGGSYGHIQTVDIRSMTEASADVQWRSLTVTFYKNGVATDSYTAGTGPAVDTEYTDSPFAEQILQVSSSHTDNDAVVVSGQFRMAFNSDVYPGPSDLSAQIFVFNTGS